MTLTVQSKGYFDLPAMYPYGRHTGQKSSRLNSPHRSEAARLARGLSKGAALVLGLAKVRHGKVRGWEVVSVLP